MTSKLQTKNKEEYKETELGLLPKDWDVVKLRDIAEISSGGSAPQGTKYFDGKNPFVRVQHIEIESNIISRWDLITDKAIEEYKLKLFPKDTIVFPKSGASIYLEKRAVLPIAAYVVSHLCTVQPNSSKIHTQFLFYTLRSLKFAEKKSETYPTLNLTEIKNIQIPFPPLPEQRKIAYVLSTAQEAKEKTERAINSLKELKKAMMKHLFTYGAVSFEDKDKVKLKETEIGDIPEGWEVKKLGEVAEVISGGTPSTSKKEYWENGNIPWIKSGQCQDCYVRSAEGYITKMGLENSSAKMLKPNSILVAMVGATIGKTGFLTFGACTNQNVAGIYPKNKSQLDNLYTFFMLQSRYEDFTKIGGFVIANLSFIKNLLIPFPATTEQQQIASILSGIDKRIDAEEQRKEALEQLFKSLLHNLMSAKIRVKDLGVDVKNG
jgi:type I restriction enzyme S subunit